MREREIIFRAKTVNTNEWVESLTIAKGTLKRKRDDWFFEIHEDKWVGVIDKTVGQYIGCKDKNGKKIYEGDIVKWDDCSEAEYCRFFAVVKINPDIQFDCKDILEVNGIKNSSNHCFHFGTFIYTDTENHLEVIGNIHDNPELIKK